jgi:hypothetical protein
VKGKDNSEDLDVDGKIILEWILGKYGGRVWTGIIRLRIGNVTKQKEKQFPSLCIVIPFVLLYLEQWSYTCNKWTSRPMRYNKHKEGIYEIYILQN